MDYDALMAFATFAQHRNFTRAAEDLFISQPALHQKVKKLSEELSTQLYVRRGRDLVLTPAGERLAAHARHVASMTGEVMAQIHDDWSSSPVVLAAGPGAFLHLLGPAILTAKHGKYPLRLLTMRSPRALTAVAEARAHLAVGVFQPTSNLLVYPLLEVGQMVVLPADHPLAGRDELSPDDLDGASLVIAPEGQPHRVTTAQVLDSRGVSWRVGVEATGWELMMRFVVYGMGVTIINDYVPVPDGLVGIPVEGFPTVTFSVAIREDSPHQGARWFLERLQEEFR